MPQTLDGDTSPSRALVIWRPPGVPCVAVTPATFIAVVPAVTAEPDAAGAPGTALALPGPPGRLLALARRTYLTVQWTGPGDRRPPPGVLRREVL